MGRKFEVTGKAVILTHDGAKIVDAECRRVFNAQGDSNDFKIRALKSLYGIDIQSSSVAATRAHLVQTLRDAFYFFTGKKFSRLDEARAIVEENFICGDSLKIIEQWTEPQLSLF